MWEILRRLDAALVTALAVWGLGVRACVWVSFGQYRIDLGGRPAVEALYLEALGEHLVEFVLYTHTKPPGLYLRDALALMLFGPGALAIIGFVGTTGLNCLAAALMFPVLV